MCEEATGRDSLLELYQFEGCPFCQRVRRSLDELGLDFVVRTIPRPHELRHRVREVSGQTEVPVLIDREHGKVIADSAMIIAYLEDHYGRKAARV